MAAARLPKGGDEDRITNLLFLPVMSPIWQLPEFNPAAGADRPQ